MRGMVVLKKNPENINEFGIKGILPHFSRLIIIIFPVKFLGQFAAI